MKALILNSGTGSRLGSLTKKNPKCMTQISKDETILSRQLHQLAEVGMTDVVITTGKFHNEIKEHCLALNLPLKFEFVQNLEYADTNYIYSMHLAADKLTDEIISMHGDLVFEDRVLSAVINSKAENCMTISSTLPLPEKDFKAVLTNNRISKVGVNFFDNAVAAQPLYKLSKSTMQIWLTEISNYCTVGNTSVYAENALNDITKDFVLSPVDVKNALCAEIDTIEDLEFVKKQLEETN
ncbi:MAG: sugar phosphate nucleotidyltransferase [Micrococcaceae bacterium]